MFVALLIIVRTEQMYTCCVVMRVATGVEGGVQWSVNPFADHQPITRKG